MKAEKTIEININVNSTNCSDTTTMSSHKGGFGINDISYSSCTKKRKRATNHSDKKKEICSPFKNATPQKNTSDSVAKVTPEKYHEEHKEM